MGYEREGGKMKKLLNLYFSPMETFKALNEKPDWIIPIVVTVVVVLIMTMIALPKVILPDRAETIMEMDQLPEEYKEKALERLEGVGPYIQTPIAIVIFSFILLFAHAGILILIFLISGSRTPFKKMLAVVSYSYLTGIPEVILKTMMMLIKKSTHVFTSLALVVPNMDFKSPLFKVLSRIDIFTIWQLCLIALGCSVIYRVDRKKSFSIIFGLWVLWLIIVLIVSSVLPKGIGF